MRSKLLTAPFVLLAACAADVDLNPPTITADASATPTVTGDAPADAVPTLTGSFEFRPQSCGDHSVFFRAHAFYSDGSPTDHVICQYEFADGSLADGCGISHAVPELQPVVLMLRDTVTGATASYQDNVVGPDSFGATVDVTTAGDTLTWHAHTLYGAAEDVGSVVISISPADTVLVDDPAVFTQRDGTVHVSADGTYTVTVQAGIQFADEGGCGASASASVDVNCD